MNRLSPLKAFAAAALGLVALAATSAAHARSDVYFSIGIDAPAPVYVQPQPVYVQPRPVYVQPQPVYVQPPYHHGWRHHHRRGPWGDRDGDGVPNAYDRWPNQQWREADRRDPRADFDRDGVPNGRDRFPGNHYRY
jgi:hypothetical protein